MAIEYVCYRDNVDRGCQVNDNIKNILNDEQRIFKRFLYTLFF